MKKVVVAISVLLIILVAGILESVYIHKTFTALDGMLKDAEASVSVSADDSLQKIEDITVWWNGKKKYMELFTYSPDLRAFSAALGEAEGSLKCGDFKNAMSKCASLIVMADNIHQLLDFNIEDII
ncbi:MAG: DUF4363 family protein [Clostridia bacterium]